ncbi:MAG: hypothetical protein JW950_06495, partial [Deltaproteobacteria bacterium]|nr:hypothetical protein [Deltaproteobacteria bacterium]
SGDTWNGNPRDGEKAAPAFADVTSRGESPVKETIDLPKMQRGKARENFFSGGHRHLFQRNKKEDLWQKHRKN